MTKMHRITAALLFLGVFLPTFHSAPTNPKENLINIKIEEVPESLISTVNNQVSGIQETFGAKAAAINGLVSSASNKLSGAYVAVGNTFSSLGDMIGEKAKTVGDIITPVVQTVGSQVNVVTDGITQGAAAIQGKFNNQYAAAQNVLTGKIRAGSDIYGEAKTVAQNALARKLEAGSELFTNAKTMAQNALTKKIEAVSDLASEGTALAQNTVTTLGKSVTDLVGQKTDAVASVAEQARGFLPKENPFAPRERKIETAILEQEDPLSKTSSVKDNLQLFVAGIFKPEPVVDNIMDESEKYGNSGDRFAPIGKALVGTTEGLASFLSNLVNVPFMVVRTVSKSVSDKFNNLGGRLIGL